MTQDTIFALSSGSPPAAIGVIRISGPKAGAAAKALAGPLPAPRRASLRRLRDARGAMLDEALLLWFPGPNNATGEDCVELHCHGGRAVTRAIEASLGALPGLRRAEPGEFTRRAFANGRMDLAQAEGLADLLEAETELQRQVAIGQAGGALSRRIDGWRQEVLRLSAMVEAELDFSDEDDVSVLDASFRAGVAALARETREFLARPGVERLREGVRVVLAGPPNAGKSTLFNALVRTDAAIVSPVAGTTRDAIERPVALDGVPFVLVDTAGLAEATTDAIEAIGIERARRVMAGADIVLWLGPIDQGPCDAWEIAARADHPEYAPKGDAAFVVSAETGAGVDGLIAALVDHARELLPRPGEVAVNERQRRLLGEVVEALGAVERASDGDPLLLGENLRRARVAFDRVVGRAATDDMLDSLFGRFCIGK